MSQTGLITILLPTALCVIMFGLGLTLTGSDFTRVARHPRAVAVALGCQVLLLPAVCFLLVSAIGLQPGLAVGMMLLAAAPGGAGANLFSHLAGGDVALNISLTLVNSVLSVVTLPIVVNLSISHFLGSGSDLGLHFGQIAEVFVLVLVPVVLGMLLRNRFPGFADRMDKPVKVFAVVFLVLVIVAVIYQERAHFFEYFALIGVVALLFSVINLSVGFLVPRLFGVERRQAIASAMEIGVHNSTLAVTIALSPSLLNNSEMAIPAAVYPLITFGTAGLFGYLISRRKTPAPATKK